jgi:hypothetical protein
VGDLEGAHAGRNPKFLKLVNKWLLVLNLKNVNQAKRGTRKILRRQHLSRD